MRKHIKRLEIVTAQSQGRKNTGRNNRHGFFYGKFVMVRKRAFEQGEMFCYTRKAIYGGKNRVRIG